MEEIAISKFKATCLAVLERVRRTRRAIRVTKFGKPVADIVPPSVSPPRAGWLGALAGTARVQGDLDAPVADADDWEALRS